MPDKIPLSRIVTMAEIGQTETSQLGMREACNVVDVAATPAECEAIAEQLKIPSIIALQGRFALKVERQNRISATLRLNALLTQICVVSLEAFETRLAEEVALIFVPADQMTMLDDDPESPDEIPFDGTEIDLGLALTEQLALSLDPYPRKPEVVLPETAQAAPANPFSLFFKQAGLAGENTPDD